MTRQNAPSEYPNAKVRLRVARLGPALPAREGYMDIWLKGTRFRVRDETGRDMDTILEDLSASNGLGMAPRSLEEIMDIWSPLDDRATELYGDVASGEGSVRQEGQPAWPMAAEKLAPVAEQILTGGFTAQLEPRGQFIRLGRVCTEYQGVLEGSDQDTYKSIVLRIESPPYLLLSSVHDANDADHYYTREVVSLEEGVTTDADLEPPEKTATK
jgi:hypothetical protein